MYGGDNDGNIVHEHIHGDGQEDDAEKFAEDENQVFAQEFLDAVELADDDVVQQDVEQ